MRQAFILLYFKIQIYNSICYFLKAFLYKSPHLTRPGPWLLGLTQCGSILHTNKWRVERQLISFIKLVIEIYWKNSGLGSWKDPLENREYWKVKFCFIRIMNKVTYNFEEQNDHRYVYIWILRLLSVSELTNYFQYCNWPPYSDPSE